MNLDGYDLDESAISTATSTVARGRQRSTGRAVAIKRIAGTHPAITGRLRHEAELLAAIHHPHVVALLDVIEDHDGLALVMPWAGGGSLAGQLASGRRFEPDDVAALLRRVASGLAAAHRSGVLHLDLKPANVLLTADGEPLLADFGIARWRRHGGPADGGTPGFVAPELLAGAEPDERADVYALGALGRALLGGAAPGARLGPVLERCLADEPEARWPSAAAVADALGAEPIRAPIPVAEPAAGVDTIDFGPRPPRPATAPVTGPERRVPRAVAAAAAVAAIAVAVALLVHPRPPAADAAPCPQPPRPGRGEVVVRAPRHGACAPAVLWSSETATATVAEGDHTARYALGRPGDVLILGRWKDRPAPALYRPATGEIFTWDGWADVDRPLASGTPQRAATDGLPRVVPVGDQDRIVVTGAEPS